MNSAEPITHHPAVSDDILLDTGARDPVFDEIYPRLPGFKLGVTNSWTRGQPFDFYRRMREDAPVMWSQIKKPSSGFWSVVRYDDVKHVELNPQIFSSQRGSINMSVLRNDKGKAERLMYAAYNSLINLDADLHRDLRTQQAAFFFPAYIETLKERVGKKIDDLLDDMERQGPVVDFAKLFSIELPMFTLCEMLGVDEEDRADIIKWMHYLELAPQFITHPFRMLLAEPSFPFRFEKILHDMFSYGERVMADRIRNPREDLLTPIDYAPLGAAKGESMEIGLKAQTADGALLGTVALFRAEQSNLAESAGLDPATGQTLYNGIDVVSEGVEFEITGRLAEGLLLQAGLTHLSLEDGNDGKVRTYVPRTTADIALRWQPTTRLSLGAVLGWQDDVYLDTALGRIEQDAYATLQLQAGYQLTDNLELQANIANVADEKYLTSLYWEQAYYAAPRNYTLTLRGSF